MVHPHLDGWSNVNHMGKLEMKFKRPQVRNVSFSWDEWDSEFNHNYNNYKKIV